MNLQTGTIEISGLNPAVLLNIEEQARTVGMTAESFLCTWVEQRFMPLDFTPQELEELREAALRSREQIAQGHYRVYANGDELMDDIEAEVKKRRTQRNQEAAVQ